ncbi:hypothetical protein AAF712_003277 [Marasmius tenuissimus]|uniref:Uncharacterized protein n=1 Tax=Marasmius tenuissimus TaxID=585030 RepID=A0ABR3A8C9_9AGAR
MSRIIKVVWFALPPYCISTKHIDHFPQALLPTKFRAQPLAQKIVDNLISSGKDGWYRPTQWKDAQHRPFSASTNYLREGAEQKTINERADVFSQT